MSSPYQDEWESPEYDNLASIAENLVYRLPGCSEVMIRKTISSVYRDFCKRTCVLRTKRRIELEHGRNAYPLVARIEDCVVDCITEVEIGGCIIEHLDGWENPSGDIICLHNRLLPPEGETWFLDVTCIEIPRLSSEKAPSLFIQRYGDAIQDGVLWELMSMMNRPWSDQQQAFRFSRAYENALTEHRTRYYGGGNLSCGKLNFIKKGAIL